jgi:predicted XRE-type DNA-binding protein
VLHTFQKKTPRTAQRDIELAAKRLREWKRGNERRELRQRLRRPGGHPGGSGQHDRPRRPALAIRERVKAWQATGGLTQEEAAARLGLTRPRLNDLMRGKLDKFSLDALVNIAATAGFMVRIALEDVKAA